MDCDNSMTREEPSCISGSKEETMLNDGSRRISGDAAFMGKISHHASSQKFKLHFFQS